MAEGVETVEPGGLEPSAADQHQAADQHRAGPGEVTPFVPERLVRAYRQRRAAWTAIDAIAAWSVAAHLLLLLVIVGRGTFYLDDLRAQGYALDQPFLEFIVGSNGTHFAPLPRILDWVQSRAFPLQHGPAVTVTVIVRLLLAIGFWRVLRRLFGPRPATLVPFAILLVTPALIPATAYYRQSITVLACTAAIIWAIDAYLRWVLYRHRADLVVLGLVTVAGLACYEKAVLVPIILVAITLAVFAGRRERPGPGRARAGAPAPVRAGMVGVLVSGLVVLVFLAIYRTGPYDQGQAAGLPSALEVFDLAWNTGRRSMIPLLLGGPFEWGYPAPYAGTPLLSETAIAFCLVISGLGMAAALWRSPGRAVRGLFLLMAWLLPSVALVAIGRFEALGLQLSTSVRLWADLVPAFLLAAALAALPWRFGVHQRAAPLPVVDSAPAAAAAPIEITVSALAGGLVVLLVLGGSVFSSLTYASKWWDNPTGQWISNARLSLENAEPYPRTLATPLPLNVMPAFVSLTFPTDAPLLLLLRPDLRFHDADGPTRVMNASGVRSAYYPSVLTEAPKQGLCTAALPGGTAPVTITLPTAAPYAHGAQVEVGLLLAEPMEIEVTVTTPDGKILTPQRFSNDELTQGPHTVRFPVPYLQSVRSITVRGNTTSKISCVSSALIWAPLS